MKKIDARHDVSGYLQHLRALQDKKLGFLAEEAPPPPPPGPPSVDGPVDQGTVDPTPDTDNVSQEATADIQKGSITLEMIVDKLNTIRAGRSFKDKSIAAQMMGYFEKLSDDEKVALYAFLKGLAQIVSGEFTGYKPVSPSDVGAPAAAPGAPAPEGEAAAPAPEAPPPSPPQAKAAPAPAPPAAPPAPAPTKKVIKTIKPNIIKRQPAPSNAQGQASPVPITPKVR
jgi:pyruvate dehydrogenase E2 component (dihydrolipoamide acetyltransferase)